MKKETAEKAREILCLILNYEDEIKRFESNTEHECGKFTTSEYLFGQERMELNKAILKHLKSKKKALEKQLENLK